VIQAAIHEYTKIGTQQKLDFSVDETLCSSCGRCIQDCPIGLIQGTLPHIEQPDLCTRCQHCMAICPTGAISIEGRKPEDSPTFSEEDFPPLEQMIQLVRGRRSIRQYQDKNVEPALIERLLNATFYAPTGVNARELTFTVIDQKLTLDRIREKVLAGLARCAKDGRIPERLGYLGLGTAPEAFSGQGIDLIFRDAPHLILVSAPFHAPGALVDVVIALTTFELLATSAGLGAVWCGLLKIVLEIAPEMKPLLGLPVDGVDYYPMLFGYPAVHYARGVQRDGDATIKRLS